MQQPKLFYFLTTLSILLLIIVASSEYLYHTKAENLQHQKTLSSAVYNLDSKDLDLANIQYRGQNTILRHESDTLQRYYTNDFIRQFFTTIDHRSELSKLKKNISSFNIAAGEWFTQETIEDDQASPHDGKSGCQPCEDRYDGDHRRDHRQQREPPGM